MQIERIVGFRKSDFVYDLQNDMPERRDVRKVSCYISSTAR